MKTILLLTVLTLLLVAVSSAGDTLVLITSRPTNYTADWQQLANHPVQSRFTVYAGPLVIDGNPFGLSCGPRCLSIAQEGTSYKGDFTKGDYLLDLYHSGPDPLILHFPTGVTQAGAQIEGRPGYNSYRMKITAADKNLNALGSFTFTLANNGKEDGSAAYYGIEDQTAPNIYYLFFSTGDDEWAMNEVSVVVPGCSLPDTTGAVYKYGDIFEGGLTGSSCPGCVKEYAPNGTVTQSYMDGSSTGETAGTAFDVAGNLYVTNWSFGTVSKLDKTGKVANPALMTPANDGQSHPESIRAVGSKADLSDLKLYVGGPACACVLVYDSAGTLLQTINVAGAGSTKGTDWIEFLTPNILIYTGEGTDIKAYDVVANTQLPDLITGLPGYRDYQLRVRQSPTAACGMPCSLPATYILVADYDRALMIDPTPWLNASPIGSVPATVTTTYSLPGVGQDFSLAIDPDAIHFWTGDTGGQVRQVNTCSSQIGYSWPSLGSNTLTVWGGLGKVW